MNDGKAMTDEIMQLIEHYGVADAEELIAAKLDVFAHQHFMRGFDNCKAAVDRVFAKWREADAQGTHPALGTPAVGNTEQSAARTSPGFPDMAPHGAG
jgi:hypothetical protein